MRAENGMTRKEFLRTSALAGAGLVIGIHIPLPDAWAESATAASLQPSAWLRIDADGTVSIVIDETELGQGSSTALAMILADELEADWDRVRLLPIPENPAGWVRGISTGGSTSIRDGWEPFRHAGAAAKAMLITAAARRWGTAETECFAEAGHIVHRRTGRRIPFGDLVEDAAQLPVPEQPPLKSDAEFRLIGRPIRRLDLRGKVDGSTIYPSDLDLPGMLVATVARPPTFGGSIRSFDATRARQVDGVVDIIQIPQGIAVLARNTWAAIEGRNALTVEYEAGPHADASSEAMYARGAELVRQPGREFVRQGDVDAALAGAAKRLEAEYRLPFLEHAAMEPNNCTAWLHDGILEVWSGSQVPTAAQAAAARVAELPKEKVVLHVPMVGGGFGRHLQPDDIVEAAEIAKRTSAPVQVFWTREDTMRHGFYRPLTVHLMRGGLDAAGNPVAWHQRVAGFSPSAGLVVGGRHGPPYNIPNVLYDYHLVDEGVPTGALRSVAYTHNGFVVESFIDELAAAAGQDPYRFRQRLMTRAPKLRAALDLAAEKAGWGSPLPAGRARGIAAVSSFSSHCAEVAEVSVASDGNVTVHRVVCAIHCGRAINPDSIAANVDGAIAIALSAALKSQLTIRNGAAHEGNFHSYPIIRFDEMPAVETYIVPSDEPPTGVGEPPLPPLAPAVANAIFAATGKRIRTLPFPTAELRTSA